MVGTVPPVPRAGAPVLVRVLARDFDSGGALSGVDCSYQTSTASGTVAMSRDPSANALDIWNGVVPGSALTLGGSFGLRCLVFDNLGAATLINPPAATAAHAIDPATLAMAPLTQNMTAGSTRPFTFSAPDDAGPPFP